MASECVVRYLDLSKNALSAKGVKYLLDYILQQRHKPIARICELNIGGVQLGVEGAKIIKRIVKTGDSLKTLYVSRQTGQKSVDKMLKGVERWERALKPPGTEILKRYEF